MHLDPDACYHAVQSRDRRFDGWFFVGVTSTGVYCRPICAVRTPLQKNCRFFASAAAPRRRVSARACAAAPSWRRATAWPRCHPASPAPPRA